MKKGNLLTLLFASAGMMVLIFDGETAISGIQHGIDICLRTLIPSLFPFFIISGLLTSAVIGQSFGFLRYIGRICRIPVGSESLFVVGILGGYPVGAKNVCEACSKGRLSLEDARRMAVFCNNAGPSFLFGILGSLFPDKLWVWMLFLIQIASAILTGMLLPGGDRKGISAESRNLISISVVLHRSIKSMALVCGWVTLFRMILEFLNRWVLWLFPIPVQVLMTGILELSNGCISLHSIDQTPVRFLLASVMLSLGGICILMQTKSVFPDLDLKRYLAGKLLQCAISFCLAVSTMVIIITEVSIFVLLTFGVLFVCLSLLFTRKRKKEVAIP